MNGSRSSLDRRGTLGPRDAGRFRAVLLDHFDRTRRPLPWRTARTSYRVLVSEFMLQQTRADTVAPYFARWLRRFPSWDVLAAASLDDVVREWQGLGYYARARNLHRTARIVQQRFGGRLPAEPRALMELPGVGEYTAAAIASIVHGRAVAAVDGNVRRVVARLLDVADPPASEVRRTAGRLLDPRRPGDFNEAMMELGATLCRPRKPRCDACPVAAFCKARAAGTAARRPIRRRSRGLREAVFASAIFLDSRGRALLAKRPDKGLLAGMWEFPGAEAFASEAENQPETPGKLESIARRRVAGFGFAAGACERLEPVKHAFSHFRATYHPVIVAEPPGASAPKRLPADARLVPVRPSGFRSVALPAAQQKIAELLQRRLAAGPAPGRPAP